MAILAYPVTGFAYQGSGLVAYQGSDATPVFSESLSGLRHRKEKKRHVVLRYSDYEKEELAAAIKAAMRPIPMSEISDSTIVYADPEADDDDAILAAVLTRLLH